SIAGRQLGAGDDRDLFPSALRLVREARPRAVLLENVRGLAARRFDGYRIQVLTCLRVLGYQTWWRQIQASEHGVPQLRPRFVLVALRRPWAAQFSWPAPSPRRPPTVGDTLHDLMASGGWPGADAWAARARGIAPTIVGGSKKHGGPDLGPTRARPAGGGPGRGRPGRAPPPPRPDLPARPAPHAAGAHGPPPAGVPGRLGLSRPQDGRVPPGGQRLPPAGRPRARHGHPAGAGA